jgi:hypothetical protein
MMGINFGSALKRIFGGRKDEPVPGEISAAGEKTSAPVVAPVSESETPVKLVIWTIERNRYSAARALCTEIETYPSDAVLLCEDISGYVLGTPNGESVVVEARTGSLVGHSLEVVRDGVREMTKIQLNAQLDTAKKEFNRMSKLDLTNDAFWQAIKMGGEEIEIAQDDQE